MDAGLCSAEQVRSCPGLSLESRRRIGVNTAAREARQRLNGRRLRPRHFVIGLESRVNAFGSGPLFKRHFVIVTSGSKEQRGDLSGRRRRTARQNASRGTGLSMNSVPLIAGFRTVIARRFRRLMPKAAAVVRSDPLVSRIGLHVRRRAELARAGTAKCSSCSACPRHWMAATCRTDMPSTGQCRFQCGC